MKKNASVCWIFIVFFCWKTGPDNGGAKVNKGFNADGDPSAGQGFGEMLERERPKYWTSPKDGEHAAAAVSETGFAGVYRSDRSASLASSRFGHDGEHEPEPVKPLLWPMVSVNLINRFPSDFFFIWLSFIRTATTQHWYMEEIPDKYL